MDTLTTSFRCLTRANKLIRNRTKSFSILESQATAVRTHAATYSNTLGGEGAKLLCELNDIVMEQKNILTSLDEAARNWDIERIARIEEEPTVSNKELFISKLKRADTIIGYLSARLVEASTTATKLNIPKVRKAQSTIDCLSLVGLAAKKSTDSE